MKIIFTILTFVTLIPAYAQFTLGSQGITVKSGTTLAIDGLLLTPSSDFNISNNSLQKSETAIPGSPNGSISRVYRFTTPVNFSGLATIAYQIGELNGNTESQLQILHTADESQGFILTTGSTVNQTIHQVSNTLSNTNLLVLTAIGSGNALPVTLIDFVATAEGQATLLKWSTSYESNADRFEIEHSTDVKSWNNVGQQLAAGESTIQKNYTYTHADVANGLNYYRLKMVDRDGTFAHSTIRSIMFKLTDATIIFPNPASERISIKSVSKSRITNVGVYEISGKLLYETEAMPDSGIELGSLVPGSYLLKIKRENGEQSTHSFFKR